MSSEEKIRTYDIPDNFIDESRILSGMFKTRNFIEGAAMALLAAIPAMLIPASDLNVRIVILVAICGPFFLLGNAGYNGDPISTTIFHAKVWYQNRGIMLYNANSRALKESPLEYMENTELPRDKLVDMVNSWKRAHRQKNEEMVYIEGETFEFVDDMDLAHLYLDKDEPEELDTRIVTPDERAISYRKYNKAQSAASVARETEETDAGDEGQRIIDCDDADVLTIDIPDDE